jgi:hypothetical protein
MRIPIKSVRELAVKCGLDQCIVFGWESRGKKQQVATWGRTLEDCASAAEGGNQIKTFCGWPNSLHTEPSRVRKLQARIKELEGQLENTAWQ